MPTILVVVWALIILLFGYSLWIDKSEENNDLEMETTIGTPAQSELVNANPLDGMTEEQIDTARIRDSKRLADIKRLHGALNRYREDNENFPEALAQLIPDYIDAVPQNPNPGGKPYTYTGIGSSPFMYYDLSYILEAGVEGINPGLHVASPGGIATP